MNTNEKIHRIRQLMEDSGIDAVVIPSNDPHQSEYVAEHWQARKWLTGFSGSAGTAVVTHKHAILWTDFRYYIQAEEQIAGSEFTLFKTGEPDVPEFQKWLADTLKPGDTIGMDGNVVSMASVKTYKTVFESKGISLDTQVDVITDLWTDRPSLPKSTAVSFSVNYAGQSREDKIKEIRKKMDSLGAPYHLISTLDDIAWALNLRGSDVHTNPVNIAFVLIGLKTVSLFIHNEKLSSELSKKLKKGGIDILEYEGIATALSEIPAGSAVLVDPVNTSYRLFQAINDGCDIIEKPAPSIALKAIKNEIQIAHLRQTAVKDGVAVVSFLFWLEHQGEDARMTEISLAGKLYELRKKQTLFVDNSFDPIMAYQDHSAMCHYSATKETNVKVGSNGMFLTDSGGNYLTGTTDITRTVFRGEPSQREIKDYTLVLKGHVCVATTLFPKGTRGFQIDTLARQYLWNAGLDFGHGTGHGVGFFLCVHEGPARISPHPVDIKLERGMLLTNEPGVYRQGAYGIRLENMILVDEAFENEFGTFMKFESLTYCHFERDLMDPGMLSQDERDWINAYHDMVYNRLSPHLEPDVASWLRKKTRKI